MMPEHHLCLRIATAFVMANAVAALGFLLRISCDPHILRSADDACFTLGDYSYAAIASGTVMLFIASSLITAIPVTAIVMLARRYKWSSAFPYVMTGAAIGPILITFRFIQKYAGAEQTAAEHYLQAWANETIWLGIIGGLSAFVFWMICHEEGLPSIPHSRQSVEAGGGRRGQPSKL
jgi:hypothetical protein